MLLPRAFLSRRRPMLRPLPAAAVARARLSSSGGGSSSSRGGPNNVTGQQDTSGFRLVQHGKDDPPRLTCTSCGWIHYDNPKIVTGAVVTYEPEGASEPLFLLCRRAIPPRKGFLNLPAGYMERGESLVAAAMREAREEATAQIECGPILAMYEIPHISQIHVYHLARLLNPDSIKPGYESLDAQLLPWSAIDFERLAFPTVSWALMHYRMHRAAAEARARQRRKGDGGGGASTSSSRSEDPRAALWEPQVPFRNPVLPGREGNTNVWFNPHKGGLVYDDSWLRRGVSAEG